MDIAFDIETIRNEAMIQHLPIPDVKTGNLKDLNKINAKVQEAKEQQIERMALSPIYGKICAWSAADSYGNCYTECIKDFSEQEEVRIIIQAFKKLSGKRVITFNGKNFDLPFLYSRAVIYQIDPGLFDMPTLSEILRKNDKHVDVMELWAGYRNYQNLDELAKIVINESKNEIDIHSFQELIKTEEGRKKIQEYCLQDSKLTMKLFNRMSGILI